MGSFEKIDMCEYHYVHKDTVESVKAKIPNDEKLYDLAELYKVFGDRNRIRILYALFESEMCVCDIATLLSLSQTAVSHQLRILKDSKLITSKRRGKSVFYSLADDHVRVIIGNGIEHLDEK